MDLKRSFCVLMSAHPISNEVQRVFRTFDRQGTGTIGVIELRRALRLLGFDLNGAYTRNLLLECARGRPYHRAAARSAFAPLVAQSHVRVRPRSVDYDGVGRIDVGEFNEVVWELKRRGHYEDGGAFFDTRADADAGMRLLPYEGDVRALRRHPRPRTQYDDSYIFDDEDAWNQKPAYARRREPRRHARYVYDDDDRWWDYAQAHRPHADISGLRHDWYHEDVVPPRRPPGYGYGGRATTAWCIRDGHNLTPRREWSTHFAHLDGYLTPHGLERSISARDLRGVPARLRETIRDEEAADALADAVHAPHHRRGRPRSARSSLSRAMLRESARDDDAVARLRDAVSSPPRSLSGRAMLPTDEYYYY